MILIFATPEEARELLGLSTRQPEIVRPQTSGPCVHYDEQTEYAADAYPCTYPYGDGTCPHLDNPDILCPVKDACYAMSEVARMRDVCEAEQDEQDADMTAAPPSQTYKTAVPEWVEPAPDEAAIRRPRFKAGDRVRISHQMFKGYTGTIRRYYAATENYLTHIDGTTYTMWLSEDYLEAV